MAKDKYNDNYLDVTNQWLENAKPNSHEIIIDDYFIDDFGIKHPIKCREKVHISSKNSDEYKMALIIEKTLGGEIHMVPRITDISNSHLGVKTPDYIWNNEKWDLKTPGLNGKFINTFERFLKKQNVPIQAKRFIINYIYFKDRSNSEIINVVNKTLNNRNWVVSVIVIKEDEIIKIFERK